MPGAGRICRVRHNLPVAARLTRHGMQPGHRVPDAVRRAALRRRAGTVADAGAGMVPDQPRGISYRAASGTRRSFRRAFVTRTGLRPGSSPEEIFGARFARKRFSATQPRRRVPDAVRRAALRRRAGTVADAGAGTVPDQPRGISYRAASGTRRSFRRAFVTRTGLRPGSSPEKILAARFARKRATAAPPARRTACPPAPAHRRLRAGRAARRYPPRTATQRSRQRRARPRY